MQTDAFMAYLEQEKQDVLNHCTACGKCVEVCPMTDYTLVQDTDPVAIVSQVITLLKTGVSAPASEAWIKSCAKSGCCIPACPEGVNPRKMLALASLELHRHDTATEPLQARRAAQANFKALHEATQLMLNVQLMPEDIQRLLPGAISQRQRPANIVFYFGCNILRTPDIALTVLDILDRLDVDYEVLGGTSNCCGITFMRAGDAATAHAQSSQTLSNMAAFNPQEILTWCASCNVHMQDFVPVTAQPRSPMRHVTSYLVERLPELRAHFVNPISKRVALHEHDGVDGVVDDVRTLLQAIPGLELIPIPQLHNQGHMCSGLAQTPIAKENVHRTVLDAAAAASVDVLANIYHACHRELAAAEVDYPFAIQNFISLIGEAMGNTHEDVFKRMMIYRDLQQIMADAAPFLEANGTDSDLVQLTLPKTLWGQ